MLNAVSTNTLYAIPRTAVGDLQSKLTKAEYEITSGEIADPVATIGSQVGLDQALRSQATTFDQSAEHELCLKHRAHYVAKCADQHFVRRPELYEYA